MKYIRVIVKDMMNKNLLPKAWSRSTQVIRCAKKNHDHSVFQLNQNSRFVSLNDVKEALEVAGELSAHQRLRYCSQRGIHYSRAVRYLKVVEQLEANFTSATLNDNDFVNEMHKLEESLNRDTYDTHVIIEDYQEGVDEDERSPRQLSSEDIARFIAEAVREKEKDEHENAYLTGEAKPYVKDYKDALKRSKDVEEMGLHARNIGLVILGVLFMHFVFIEWCAFVGNGT